MIWTDAWILAWIITLGIAFVGGIVVGVHAVPMDFEEDSYDDIN